MSVLSSIGRLAARYSAARSRYHSERAIRSLPLEVQKDIGWPELSGCGRRGDGPCADAERAAK